MISPGMFLEIIRIFFCSEKSLEFLENLNFSKCSTKYVIPGEISSQKFEDSVRGFFFSKVPLHFASRNPFFRNFSKILSAISIEIF